MTAPNPQQNIALEPPVCVSRMLAQLEHAARELAAGAAKGPYLLEALLDDVRLCPSIVVDPSLVSPANQDAGNQLAMRIEQARDAARLVIQCPEVSRAFADERLTQAIAAARRALAERVAASAADGDRSALIGDRCNSCVFAQREG